MPTPENTSPIIDRLITLTQKGRLQWTYLYPDDPTAGSGGSLQHVTAPYAYVLEDEEFGFGTTILQLADPMNESNSPALFMHGGRVEATDVDVSILRDEIILYFEDIQQGRVPTPSEQFHNAVMAATQPFQAELERQQAALHEQRQMTKRQFSTLERLSETVLNQTYMLQQMMAPAPNFDFLLEDDPAVPDLASLEAAGETTWQLPMSSETLQTAITFLFGDEITEHLTDEDYHEALGVVASKILSGGADPSNSLDNSHA